MGADCQAAGVGFDPDSIPDCSVLALQPSSGLCLRERACPFGPLPRNLCGTKAPAAGPVELIPGCGQPAS